MKDIGKVNERYRITARQILGTREEQQDRFAMELREDSLLAAVFDGMGGMEGGSLASSLAAEVLQNAFAGYRRENGAIPFLAETVDMADDRIALLKDINGKRLKTGTTAVIVLLEEDNLYWASVGDSRLYIIRDGSGVQATRDHNYRGQLQGLLETGSITQDEYRKELRQGEALVSYLGMGGVEIVDINQKPFSLKSGDRLLLCSDGLYKTVPHAEVVQIVSEIKDLERAANALIRQASCYGSGREQDNTTFILAEMR